MVEIITLKPWDKYHYDGAVLDVNVTSRGSTYKWLSPFYLGPYKAPCGRVAQRMENLWQYSKVYSSHTGMFNNVTRQWLEWSTAGFNSDKAERYPMGKGTKPEFLVWGKERLGYIEARKEVYVPSYSSLLYSHPLWEGFRKCTKKYDYVIIRDFDVYNIKEAGVTYEEAINDPNRKFGHGFVVAMMLEEQ